MNASAKHLSNSKQECWRRIKYLCRQVEFLLLFFFFRWSWSRVEKPAEYVTTVDSRVHALMRRLAVFLSNSKRTRGGGAMSCCCACYIKSVWPRDDSMEKNNLMASSWAAMCLSRPFFPPAYPALTSHGGGMVRMKEGLLGRSPICISSISFPRRPKLAGWVSF